MSSRALSRVETRGGGDGRALRPRRIRPGSATSSHTLVRWFGEACLCDSSPPGGEAVPVGQYARLRAKEIGATWGGDLSLPERKRSPCSHRCCACIQAIHPATHVQKNQILASAMACSTIVEVSARILRAFSADVEKPWRACSRAAGRRLQVFYTPREQPRKQGTPCDRDAGCTRTCPRRVCGRCPSFRFIEPGCPRFRSIGPGRPSFRFCR